MKLPNAPQVIREIYEITDKPWLFGATLLGAIRENRILEWDKDVDLGFPSEHVTPELLSKFEKAGFTIVSEYKFSHKGMEKYIPDSLGLHGKVILKKLGVKVELCCFAKGSDGRYYYASGTPRFFVLNEDMVYPIETRPFYDYFVNVPKNAEKQLEFVYGKDWRTPREKWYFTPDHYLRREHTIIELGEDDKTKWSKWTGRKIIAKKYKRHKFPSDINTPHNV